MLDGHASAVDPILGLRDGELAGSATTAVSIDRDRQQGRVTMVAHDVGPVGGMERQLTELIGGLLDRGFRVTVISRTCAVPRRQGLRWVHVRGPARPFTIAYPWFAVVGSALTAVHRSGILHVTGAIVANGADVVTVHLCHAAIQNKDPVLRSSRPGRLYSLNARIAARLSLVGEAWHYRRRLRGALVAVSGGVADEVRRFYPSAQDKIQVIPNGVSHDRYRRRSADRVRLRRELGIHHDRLVAIFVGGEWQRKGLGSVVDAVALIEDVELIVVGAGDQERVKAREGWRAVGDRVHFVGRQATAAPYYSAADVFVLPSIYEAAPLVVYEAAAAGLPLLITRVNGVEQVMEHGGNGWFIERAPQTIASRLRELKHDRALLERMSERSRALATCHSWPAVVDAYVDLYGVLSAPRGEPR